jgi:hypothetical protein
MIIVLPPIRVTFGSDTGSNLARLVTVKLVVTVTDVTNERLIGE